MARRSSETDNAALSQPAPSRPHLLTGSPPYTHQQLFVPGGQTRLCCYSLTNDTVVNRVIITAVD